MGEENNFIIDLNVAKRRHKIIVFPFISVKGSVLVVRRSD